MPSSSHPLRPLFAVAALGLAVGGPAARTPASSDLPAPDSLLREVAAAVGDRRIVLLGENGHGVAEFTQLKVHLVRYLHEHLGFSVLAMESGVWECNAINDQLPFLSPPAAIRGCLTYAMEHTDLIPLFDYLKAQMAGPSPLRLSGIDLQIQSGDSRSRAGRLRIELTAVLPHLVDTVIAVDSALVVATAAGPDGTRSVGADAWSQRAGTLRFCRSPDHRPAALDPPDQQRAADSAGIPGYRACRGDRCPDEFLERA